MTVHFATKLSLTCGFRSLMSGFGVLIARKL